MRKSLKIREYDPGLSLEGCCPLLSKIYSARGIKHVDQLDRNLNALLPYHLLSDIDKACARLKQAIDQQEKTIIIGDYDVDGATSTALMMKMLQAFGLSHVSYLVPNRFEYGYGLSPEIVREAAQSSPNLIITVDNGIVNHAGVDVANDLDIDVIITDHHLPGETLPAAYAVVNPNRSDDVFPSKTLSGVGVAFYLMVALRVSLREQGWFATREEPSLAEVLDLVALGTVADLVPLDSNNRLMVYQGIQRIRRGLACPGIQALMQVSGKMTATLSASDLGFALAPRLNAVGRLDDMRIGIDCLLAKDLDTALPLAQQLDTLNTERRSIEKSMKEEADAIVSQYQTLPEAFGYCLYQPHWHQGVVGLVASRIKDRVHRPVVVFAKAAQDSTELKGSCRSIADVHIRDLLAEIAAQHPGIIAKFGGHAMAAGLSIEESALPQFQQHFQSYCAKKLGEQGPEAVLETDGELTPAHLQLDTARSIHDAGPWGQGFPEPLFQGRFQLMDQRLVGKHHLKMVLQPFGSGLVLEAIAFFVDLSQWPDSKCREIIAAYRMDINQYLGRSKLQLIVEYFEKK